MIGVKVIALTCTVLQYVRGMVGLRAVAEFDTFHPEGDALQAVGNFFRRSPATTQAARPAPMER